MTAQLELRVIHTDSGVFIQTMRGGQVGSTYLFDGKEAETTFHSAWSRIDTLPSEVYQKQPSKEVNRRYELIDPKLRSAEIPDVLPVIDGDDGYGWALPEDKRHLSSLYSFKVDYTEEEPLPIDFVIKEAFTVDELIDSTGFNFTRRYDRRDIAVTEGDVQYQIVDKITLPGILLPLKPCMLTSEASYGIVRAYIKNHINPQYATISSDYDFCFQVDKRITLAEPVTYRVNLNASYPRRKPKYEERLRTDRAVVIFEMTHANKPWRDYTVLPGFKGENLLDLEDNITAFCEDIVQRMNEPIEECKHCKGSGIKLK
jgi:hypothetical protein